MVKHQFLVKPIVIISLSDESKLSLKQPQRRNDLMELTDLERLIGGKEFQTRTTLLKKKC